MHLWSNMAIARHCWIISTTSTETRTLTATAAADGDGGTRREGIWQYPIDTQWVVERQGTNERKQTLLFELSYQAESKLCVQVTSYERKSLSTATQEEEEIMNKSQNKGCKKILFKIFSGFLCQISFLSVINYIFLLSVLSQKCIFSPSTTFFSMFGSL